MHTVVTMEFNRILRRESISGFWISKRSNNF